MGKLSAAEVLRLRATSAVSRDQSARRFAQDDECVGELTERRPLCGSRGALQIPAAFQDDDSDGDLTWENRKRINPQPHDIIEPCVFGYGWRRLPLFCC